VPLVCQDAAFPRCQPERQPAGFLARVAQTKGSPPTGGTVEPGASRCAFAANVSISHRELVPAAP
jgi:hypothetical protein